MPLSTASLLFQTFKNDSKPYKLPQVQTLPYLMPPMSNNMMLNIGLLGCGFENFIRPPKKIVSPSSSSSSESRSSSSSTPRRKHSKRSRRKRRSRSHKKHREHEREHPR